MKEGYIPGGRRLADYVAHRTALYIKAHYAEDTKKLERQRALLKKKPIATTDHVSCRNCHFVVPTEKAVTCKRNPGHGSFCTSCQSMGECALHCLAPCAARHCGFLVSNIAASKCDKCKKFFCNRHRQYCPRCGLMCCLKPGDPEDTPNECMRGHGQQCPWSVKRVKVHDPGE